jgi:lysophospholipase L1-like esterase
MAIPPSPMTPADIAATGYNPVDATARADTTQRTRVLASCGRTGPVYGAASAGVQVVLSVPIPAKTIMGGETLRIRGLLSKYQPFNGGGAVVVRLGGVVIAQAFPSADLASYPIDHVLTISSDRKWAFTQSQNLFGVVSPTKTSLLPSTYPGLGATSSMGVRAASSTVAFVTYSTPPTAETILVNFDLQQLLTVEIAPVNGDTMELVSFSSTLEASAKVPTNYASPKATVQWGTSITEGTGAAAVSSVPMGCVDVLRRTRAGRPIVNGGLGGQTSSQIADRLVADPVAGKYWDAVLDMIVNDASGDGPTWWNQVRTQIDRVLAFRSSSRTIIWNAYPNTAWTTGTAFRTAMDYVNAQLVATYGPMVVDVCTPFIAGGTNGVGPAANYADAIHPTNAGHAILAAATDAKMTSLGWL